MEIIERLESEVRSYCRSFPTVFTRAEGARLFDHDGREYLDFFAGAGALNYGHNHPVLRERLIEYLVGGGIAHSLDMATAAKCDFLAALDRVVLRPRDLRYKVMFPGPTGTNAVEAALKLARKVTGRTQVVSFTNAFHGMTLGSLAATGNAGKRAGAGVPLGHVVRAPFDGYFGPEIDTLEHLEALLADRSSGVEAPAAFLLETVQAEGGINVASDRWLRGLATLARRHGALLIVDDIQVGCGRTGAFFSFEQAGITPDIVCLSKSLSGFGLPFAVTLMRPDIDAWSPGEHNGTFRGNNLAFVTATAALERFWSDEHLGDEIESKADIARARLGRIARAHGGQVRGRGLILGLAFDDASVARRAARRAFDAGLVIETAGAEDQVLKLLPPLTITGGELERGLDIIERAVAGALERPARSRVAAAPTAPRPARVNGHSYTEVVS
ncbi:MAG TPA: diaminobutyrate--2-oxoglutarate transaminase [Kofleriaceae bacterium]|nr:diaminobutyrate--2-oxoglutarate transaminase [Kofleriaceae bacterium]